MFTEKILFKDTGLVRLKCEFNAWIFDENEQGFVHNIEYQVSNIKYQILFWLLENIRDELYTYSHLRCRLFCSAILCGLAYDPQSK
jgi:hypothetical protein